MGTQLPQEKGGTAAPPHFWAYVLWPNGWMNLGTEVALGPGQIVLDGDPASSAEESGTTPPISAHVCCGQTAGWIKIPVGRDVELGPGDIVSDRDPLKRGTSPPLFGPCLLWPNGWIDQNATSYGGRPRLRPHCVKWGPSSPVERGTAAPLFSAHVCGQTVAHFSYC